MMRPLAVRVAVAMALSATSCATTSPGGGGATPERPAPSGPALRIVDSGKTEVVIRGAGIDYGGLMSDRETTGIRARLGEGTVTIRWRDVAAIAIVPEPNAPPRLDVTLRNGQRATATLVRSGRMQLTGQTDLGTYAIELERIRTITPVDAAAPPAR